MISAMPTKADNRRKLPSQYIPLHIVSPCEWYVRSVSYKIALTCYIYQLVVLEM